MFVKLKQNVLRRCNDTSDETAVVKKTLSRKHFIALQKVLKFVFFFIVFISIERVKVHSKKLVSI